MKYDAVLYDFDGTLVDTVPVIVKCFQQAFLNVLGHTEDEAFILSTIGLPLSYALSGYDPAVQKALFDEYQKENAVRIKTEVRVFEGVSEGLALLGSMGVRQGVVTSKNRKTALINLEQFAMVPFFEVLITGEDTNVHKPNPEPILLALEKMEISDLSRVLYVGDSVHDLRCAYNAGVDSAAVNWTYMPKNELAAEKPAYWLDRLTDLSCILSDAEL